MFLLGDLYEILLSCESKRDATVAFWEERHQDFIHPEKVPEFNTVKEALLWSCIHARKSGIKVWYESDDVQTHRLLSDIKEMVHEFMGVIY